MVVKIKPGITKYFGPNVSNNLPVIGDIIPFTIPPGNKTRPAAKADNNIPPFKYIGNRMDEDKMIIIPRNTIKRPMENIGNLNTRKLSIGCSILNWRKEKRIRLSAPTMIGKRTVGSLHEPAPSPALLNPKTIPPKPMDERIIDRISIFGFVMVDTFCI